MFHHPSFWFFVSFVLFFAILGKRLWHTLRTQLDDYRNAIMKEFEETKRLRAEAAALLIDIEKKHREAEHVAATLLQNAKKEIKLLKEQAVKEMETFLQIEEQTMAERIKIAETEIVRELRDYTLTRALDLAKDNLAKILTPENDSQWIEQALEGVKEGK